MGMAVGKVIFFLLFVLDGEQEKGLVVWMSLALRLNSFSLLAVEKWNLESVFLNKSPSGHG